VEKGIGLGFSVKVKMSKYHIDLIACGGGMKNELQPRLRLLRLDVASSIELSF
jgi:hypothetical protein